MHRPRRRALVALVTAAPLLLTAGCGVLSQSTTSQESQIADGVNAQVGDVDARNLLVVGQKGSAGLVSGALVNNGGSPVVVTVTAPGAAQPVQVQVPAGTLVDLGNGTDQTSVATGSLKAPAGSLVQLQLSTPSGGSVSLQVPVLSADGIYSGMTPTAD